MSMLTEFLRSTWFKDHQTFVGSLVAFSGLSIGWIVTAWLNRRHADHMRYQEATSLAALLAGEVQAMQNQVRAMGRHFQSFKQDISDTERPVDFQRKSSLRVSYTQPKIFEGVGSKIGLLGPDLAYMICDWYFRLYDLLGTIELIQGQEASERVVIKNCELIINQLGHVDEAADSLKYKLMNFARTGKRPPPVDVYLSELPLRPSPEKSQIE